MEKVMRLAETLADLGLRRPDVPPLTFDKILADQIIQHPHQIVDALVEAGVLELHIEPGGPMPPRWYSVVQPHKHEWRADAQRVMNGTVEIYCASCPPNVLTHNRLPIEVPE